MRNHEQDPTSLDRAWKRYVETGCPQSLGEVYDAASPVLILLAARLLGEPRRSPERAFDLLQTTFLEAIRSATSFDQDRPALPWLASILTRRAHDLRRNESRRTPVALDPTEEPDARVGDPLMAAEFEDTRAVVREAIEGLPTPYRTVLNLHLLHELSPLEISAALERPLSTVHSQLRRGLKQLRTRRPSRSLESLLGLGWFSTSTDRLHQLTRDSLLEAAGSSPLALPVTGTLSTSGALVGFVVMKKLILPAAVLLLLSASLYFGMDPASPAPDVADSSGSVGERSSRQQTTPDRTPGSAREFEGAASLTAQQTKPVHDATEIPLVWGRCVDMDGTPVPSVRVSLRVRGSDEPLEVTGGADGRFRVTAPMAAVPALLPLKIVFRDAFHLDRHLNSQAGNVGDVQMIRGGRVVARLDPHALGPHHSWSAVAHLREMRRSHVWLRFTKAHLVSQPESTLYPGVYRFSNSLSHAFEIEPAEFEISPGETTEILLRPKLRPAISGIVRGGSWEQIRPTIRVHQYHKGGVQQADGTNVNSSGEFTVWQEGKKPDTRLPLLNIYSPGFDPVEIEASWGTTNLDIQLTPRSRILFDLKDTGGQEIRQFDVSVTRDPDVVEWVSVGSATSHPLFDEYDGLPKADDTYHVWVRSRSAPGAVAGPFTVTLDDRDEVVRARLDTDNGLRVMVRDAEGRPVPAQKVVLTAASLKNTGLLEAASPQEAVRAGQRPASKQVQILASATTDASGKALLPAAQLKDALIAVLGVPGSIQRLAVGQTAVELIVPAAPEQDEIAAEGQHLAVITDGSVPTWVEAAWIVFRSPRGQHLVATGLRLGDTFWFDSVPTGPMHLVFSDPTAGFSEATAAPLLVTDEERLHRLDSLPVLPGRMRVPRLPAWVGLELSNADGTLVYETGPGDGNDTVVLPAGAFRAEWIRPGKDSVRETVVITSSAMTTLQPPKY